MIQLSVVICTHNPKEEILNSALAALQEQTLENSVWEILLIDNLSSPPLCEVFDLSWHPNARVVVEPNLGLTSARIRGIAEARSELIVFVDDDNILAPDYLRLALDKAEEYPEVGVFGGKAIPIYEQEPASWFSELGISLGCRDLGDQQIVSAFALSDEPLSSYPEYSPIGTGMVLRHAVGEQYAKEIQDSPVRKALDRTGKKLVSGGDNDLVLTAIGRGWGIAYFPDLYVEHRIPAGRLTQKYLERMSYDSMRSWVMVLHIHGIYPWQPIYSRTVWIRKIRSYFRSQAWKSPKNKIVWRGQCGQLDGRRDIGIKLR